MKIHRDLEQGSPEWDAVRVGMPTTSDFPKIITSTGAPSKQAETYALTLAAEIMAGGPVEAWQGNEWTDRGKALEGDALRLYEFTRDLEIELVGFVTDDTETMGCSPDALVGAYGLAEVKCLKAENHIKAILYYLEHGRCPPGYVQQTQGQMMICERAWCDLVFYHDALPLLVIRQEPDPAIQRALKGAIPTLCNRRDIVVEQLRNMAGGGKGGPSPTLTASLKASVAADMSADAPIF